ncbi:MAG: peptide chain release factor N(5)-glutamine methyltransferase [Magnetococcales bacterium]|nr:peptide chain release factor N(5)-glutamine methyltransferase [Magnetococcales bacterium]
MNPPVWTIRKLLQWSSPWLAERGVDSPRLDAELLLADTLELERIGLFLDPDRPLTRDELDGFKNRLKRRALREPVAYIIGRKDFWKDSFVVDPHVLIPRPETETLLECVLNHYTDRNVAWRFLEIGCGSGALLISLMREFPFATGMGLDISREAIAISALNARKTKTASRIDWLESDLLHALKQPWQCHAMVANLPYIAQGDIPSLQPEVALYEPRLALDGGVDGLQIIRQLIPSAAQFLAPGGLLALEIDSRQRQEVVRLLESNGFGSVSSLDDCHHVPRVVFGIFADGRQD